jgi:CRISPR-associated endonuclease/helicase Cas3
MEEKTAQAPPTPVNVIRKEVLTACREAARDAAGLYSLTVPTGGGKTLSGLAFALEHAVRHGKSRIVYVIAYTSIIEQTAQVLSEIFGPENVVEHHSNLAPERETERSRLASENWDAPILVTTNVQFFESLYAARSSRCRKLHNLVNSVVILDEAQLLPPELLTPCVDVLNHLTRHYGVTVLLSTATQPALPGLDPAREIVPDKIRLYETLKRTEIRFPDSLQEPTDWETVAEELRRHEQALCVVNTRRDCYDLFRLMPEGTIHLSALMCGEHRSQVIAEIKRHLKEGAPCRVISTQLVEGGVDLDFPVVYRALAGLDSIAQAAGRCNREGRLNAEGRLGVVRVFVPPKPRRAVCSAREKARRSN